MYSYIVGKVKVIKSNYIVLENNFIGYKVFVPNPFGYELEKEEKVYLHNQIREDEYSLYGFKSIEEYELFLKLISVKGLGPKVAMPFFALGSFNGIIDAINRENVLYLKKFPKVGEKLAKQIVLDLKGKLNSDASIDDCDNDDVVLALEALGYKSADIRKVIMNVDKELSVSQQVKEALKLLME